MSRLGVWALSLLAFIPRLSSLSLALPLQGRTTRTSPISASLEDPWHHSLVLPRHFTNPSVCSILENSENAIHKLRSEGGSGGAAPRLTHIKPQHKVYSNSYVDLGNVRAVGFDYDYTLVHYSPDLLELIYDMAGKHLIESHRYPKELSSHLKYDNNFSIRGLAVDKETGWICHLSSTHKVSLAYLGRNKVTRAQMAEATSGKNAMSPKERAERLRPMNDLFSMSEASLIADVIEYFERNSIPYHPKQVVDDCMGSIGEIHRSLAFHREVAKHPDKYFEKTPFMKTVLENLRSSSKSLFLISNSPFWFVDAGMRFNFGNKWRELFSTVITSAGKPKFYTEKRRPFREVLCGDETNEDTTCAVAGPTKEAVSYEKVTALLSNKVYTEGCLTELTRLVPSLAMNTIPKNDLQSESAGGDKPSNSKVLYVGDSLFADLVDAKREFGWYTAGVLSELRDEVKKLRSKDYLIEKETIEVLLATLRIIQDFMVEKRTAEDAQVLDRLEHLVSLSRDRMNGFLGNERFGSIFSARYQPSLFSASLLRYCDIYLGSVEALVNYSPYHRFYPDFVGTLPHQERSGREGGAKGFLDLNLLSGVDTSERRRVVGLPEGWWREDGKVQRENGV